MSKRIVFILLLFLLVMTLAPATYAAPGDPASDAQSADPEGVLRLEQATDGEASVTISSATGAASFVRLPADENAELLPLAEDGETVEAMAMAFFSEYGGIFGITDPRTELRLEEKGVDTFDLTHLVYYQFYRDVPVFAADLRVHFDAEERLTAVNGVFIPDLNLDPHPSVSAAVAETIAVQTVAATKKIAATTLTASPATLYVFRQGLVQGGMPGPNHLVYEVVVSGPNVRKFVSLLRWSGPTLALPLIPASLHSISFEASTLVAKRRPIQTKRAHSTSPSLLATANQPETTS